MDFLAGLEDTNEATIVRELGHLMTPSPHALLCRGEITNKNLYSTMDEMWTMTVPIMGSSTKWHDD